MKKIRPFVPQEQEWMIVDNALFDHIMPSLSPNAWKVLCFILRKTEGWHKEWDGLSYTQIMEGTSIKSSATVSKAIKELLDQNYIRRVQTPEKWDSNLYALNLALEIEVDNGSTLENEVKANSENEVESTLDSKDTKEQHENTRKGQRGGKPPAPDYIDHVLDHAQKPARAGVADPSQDIEAYWAYASEFVAVFHRITGYRPATSQKPKIEQLAIKEGADVDLWEKVVDAWMGVGWNRKNIDGMIACYLRGEIPSTGKNGGKRNAPNNRSGRVPGRVPEYSVADPAAFGEQPPDDDAHGEP